MKNIEKIFLFIGVLQNIYVTSLDYSYNKRKIFDVVKIIQEASAMKRISLISTLLLMFLVSFFSGAAESETFEITYATQSQIELKADVIVPQGEGPFPIVVAFHGGGFVRGEKEDISRQCNYISKNGYVVFNANYRTVSQGAHFPGFVKDAHSAVLWIKKHAKEYKGNPDQIALTGFSAGAYIASITAVTPHISVLHHKDPRFEDMSSEVQAVIPFYGHQNLNILDEVQIKTATFVYGKDISHNKKLLNLGSPVYHIGHAVPTLLFHNEIDPLVPVEQSRSMYSIYKDKNLPVYFYEFPRNAHDLLRPDEDWALGVTIKFLDKYLKRMPGIEMPESIP